MAVPGFPNLQIMYGPNTNTGGGSVIFFLEAQAKHVADYVAHVARTGQPHVVRREVEEAHDREVQASLSGSVWSQCTSWYRQADGRIPTNWPGLSGQYRRSEEHTSELQSLMRISYAVFCLKNKKNKHDTHKCK